MAIEKKDKKKGEKKIKPEDYVDLEPTIDEALTLSQRRAKARAMRRNKTKIAMARKRNAKRKASEEKLKKRALKKARDLIRKRMLKTKSYNELTPTEKVALDKRLEKIPNARFQRIAKKLMPQVRKAELERLARVRGGVKEEIEMVGALFESVNAPEDMSEGFTRDISDKIRGIDRKELVKRVKEMSWDQVVNMYHRNRDLEALKRKLKPKDYYFIYLIHQRFNNRPLVVESKSCDLITRKQMKVFEKVVDKLFAKYGIDFEFTKHFGERMGDERNDPCITLEDLAATIKKLYALKGRPLKNAKDAEAVLHDLQSDLNIPMVIKYDPKNDELDVVAKTIMRKKNFRTRNKKIRIK